MSRTLGLLDSLGLAEDGISTAYPDTFRDDITAAYNEDADMAASRVAILEADNAALTAEIVGLKAHNYELMVSVPSTDSDAETVEESEETESDDDNDDNSGIDSLFKEKE